MIQNHMFLLPNYSHLHTFRNWSYRISPSELLVSNISYPLGDGLQPPTSQMLLRIRVSFAETPRKLEKLADEVEKLRRGSL